MDIQTDYSGEDCGKYHLIQRLGNGQFGVVYKAYDKILKVEKAIKFLKVTDAKEAYKLFNEASIPYKCKHDNIIKINSAEVILFKDDFVFVIDMELVCGESVEAILKHEDITVLESLDIIRKILFAVEYSHLQGIIHRDIKPANILLDNNEPKLSDFGLSTMLGTVIKPWKWYMTHAAPETFVNNSIATVETDIFAIGMTLYRMVNRISDWEYFLNRIPNVGNRIKEGKLIDILPSSPYIPEKIHKIIKKACRKSPENRYSSATEMRNAIEKLRPYYNWREFEQDYWVGRALGLPKKEIFIEKKRNNTRVVVMNNGRKSSRDSKTFVNEHKAREYLMEYVKETTLQ